MKNYSEAIATFDLAIQKDANQSQTYNAKSVCLSKQNNLKEAFNFLNKAIQLDPDNADYFNNRAFCLVDLKNYMLALRDFKK